MKKINNILWKLLGVIVAMLTNTSRSVAAEKTFYFCDGKKNYYVKKCGSYEVGLNWLKTATTTTDVATSIYSIISPNDTYEENVNNFRKYISTAGGDFTTIDYHIDSTDKDLTTQSPNMDAGYQLSRACSPYVNGVKNTFECQPCPNSGVLPDEPSVNINYDTHSIIAHTWKFYTIADCFLQDFSDTTGTFYYIDPFASTTDSPESKCYYKPKSEDIEGTPLNTDSN